ncbi:MAG TPA: Mor transcription activator family protein [Candidatus Binatia bacterium]|nr:Mor transcription activator family protein [Candidatus Binatia bacterium]
MDTSVLRINSRLGVKELLVFFGQDVTTRLIRHGGGRRIPSQRQYRSVLRQLLVVRDWRAGGYSQPALAAKYGISLPHVKRILTQHRRQHPAAKPGSTRGSQPAGPPR